VGVPFVSTESGNLIAENAAGVFFASTTSKKANAENASKKTSDQIKTLIQ
jgi:hypothetical protein